jgi:hypothetical protein
MSKSSKDKKAIVDGVKMMSEEELNNIFKQYIN